MSNRASRIREQLGMSHGAAANKLRKNILFSLLQEVGRNNCYVCGEEISYVSHLSIEHIQPWEGRLNGDILFWDMNNIAFSHIYCNKQHTHNKVGNRGKTKKVGPKGKAWCCGCQEFKDVACFQRATRRANGYQAYCKECRLREQ